MLFYWNLLPTPIISKGPKGLCIIVVTYEIRVFFEGAKKEVFSNILKKHYKNTKA
jgi:hypothetical protein